MKIWVLVDEKAGHRAQAIGVAEALGYGYTEKPLQYNALANLPNCILGSSFSSIKNSPDFNDITKYPDILIACGRRQTPVARMIKNIASSQGKKLFYTQLMWPRKSYDEMDLIAVPEHDSEKLKSKNSRIIKTIGAAHNITLEKLESAKEQWKDKLNTLSSPKISLMIGGKTGKFGATQSHIKSLIETAKKIASDADGSLLITTSRRTEEAAISEIKNSLSELPENKKFLYVSGDGENPYLAMLGFADVIFVTGDSISMACEAISTGKPVIIFVPDKICPPKHRILHQQLENSGAAKIIKSIDELEEIVQFINNFRSPKILSAAQHIASKIRETLSLANSKY